MRSLIMTKQLFLGADKPNMKSQEMSVGGADEMSIGVSNKNAVNAKILFKASLDGTNYFDIECSSIRDMSTFFTSSTDVNTIFSFDVSAVSKFSVWIETLDSGSIDIYAMAYATN